MLCLPIYGPPFVLAPEIHGLLVSSTRLSTPPQGHFFIQFARAREREPYYTRIFFYPPFSVGSHPIILGTLWRVRGALDSLRLLRRPLPDIPAPASQDLDHLGRQRRGERYADEDEGFVEGVCEG